MRIPLLGGTRPSRFVAAIAALAVLAMLCIACTSDTHKTAETKHGRPNIIFVLTDDLATNLVPYMPHVQAMQKAGLNFSNYFVVDSLCCPSRSAIFTGEYPHDDGVFTNGGNDGGYQTYKARDDEQRAFAVQLQNAGYQTGFMGKYLNGYLPKNAPEPGWSEWDAAGNGYPEFGYKLNQDGKTQQYGHDPNDYLTDVVSNKAVSFIDKQSSAHSPFMLEVATFAPHAPSTPAPRDANDFPGLTAPHTPAYDTTPTDAPDWLKAFPALSAADRKSIDEKYRKRAQSVQAVDDMIGRLEQEVKAKGLADDTYFVFSSDNGFHMGDYRLRPGKQTAFDTDIRVPLVITGPGIAAGSSDSKMVSSIDLAPTFESLSGASIESHVDGTSLAPLLTGSPPSSWQDAVLVEHHGPDTTKNDPDKPGKLSGDPPSYEAVRTPTALYVEYDNAQREYYDLAKDPYELHNLASTATAAQLAPVKAALAALRKCTGRASCQAAAGAG